MSGNSIDLTGAWSKVWSSFGGNSNFWLALAMLGVVFVAWGIAQFIWEKRRGSGGNTSSLVWKVVLGCLLAGPNLVIPIVLGIFDVLANLIVKLVKSAGLA